MEGSKAEHVETGPVSAGMFQRLAGHPFPSAVTVTHLEGEEVTVERSCHTAFVCVRLILTGPARALRALGLAAPQHAEARWPGWWLCESHGHSRVAENAEHNL